MKLTHVPVGHTLTIDPSEINGDIGNGLYIIIPGYARNPNDKETQILIERYEGKINIHVWNADQDPETLHLDPYKPTEIEYEDPLMKF